MRILRQPSFRLVQGSSLQPYLHYNYRFASNTAVINIATRILPKGGPAR